MIVKLVVSLNMHQKVGTLIKIIMLKNCTLIFVSKPYMCKDVHLMLLCMQSMEVFSLFLQKGNLLILKIWKDVLY